MNNLIQTLRTLLATNFTLYLKTQMFHWNVEGPDFPQYHDFFAEVYGDIYEQNDRLAEYIRIKGFNAPGSLSVYNQISLIKDEDSFPIASAMMTQLLSDNEIMISLFERLYEVAEETKDHGISNYATERLDAHGKLAWKLRSILKVQ